MNICTCRIIPPDLAAEARRAAIFENPHNGRGVRDGELVLPRAAVSSRRRWANGRTISVAFLDGSSSQRGRVQPYFHRWEEYANLKFQFVANPVFSDVRVTFDGDGSWSYVGTDALTSAKDEPTMGLGWLGDGTEESEYQRVVLHEAGHVLGFDHEDQQPAEAIRWDVPKVLAYYEGPPNNWTADEVYSQVLSKVVDPSLDYTAFDRLSIMAYPVPAELTLDGVGVPLNLDLSAMDKVFASQMYPGVTVPPVELPPLPLGGPQTIGTLSSFSPTIDYRVVIPANGTYRVWTSQLGGPVSLYHPSDMTTPVLTGVQQFTGKLPAGAYVLRVVAADVTVNRNVRIHSRRLG